MNPTDIEHKSDEAKTSTEHVELAAASSNTKPYSEHVEYLAGKEASSEHVEYATGTASELPEISPKKAQHLKLHRSLAIGFQMQVFLASHIVSRDVIGVTVVAGIEQFVHMKPTQFEWTQAALYFTYAALPVPFAFVFQRSNPRVFCGLEMFCWGLCTTFLGLCVNYAGMTADRVIMGVAMNFALPAMLQVVYEWHGRYEGQFIFACSWACSWFMVPLFALIAIALGLIHDGKPGWSWMFFITGICGCLQAPLVWKLLPDYFYHPRWIKKHGEDGFQLFKKITENDYAGGNPVERTETALEGLVMALKDPIVWTMGAIGMFTYTGIFSAYNQLLTVTMHVLKYSPALSQCIVWPILVFSCMWCLVQSWLSSKYKCNYAFLLTNYLFAIIGWALVLCTPSHKNFWIKYGGAWFILPNTVAAFPTAACWLGSNIQGRNRRLMSFAVFASITNWYGVVVLRTFVAKEVPLYNRACWVNMAFMIASVVLVTALMLALRRRNSRGGSFVYLL